MSPTHSQAVLDVPRHIKWAAYAFPLCALPSGLWRIALVTGSPNWYAGHVWLPGERPCALSLSLAAECLALLTLGLVKPGANGCPPGCRSPAAAYCPAARSSSRHPSAPSWLPPRPRTPP
ncbi:hypothetical protein [Streptomyces narbonensis]|uniref:hypothetical protein n=1 Tax=Streptomyces narbonensis TaxID=67333 RepID=UPI0033FA9580